MAFRLAPSGTSVYPAGKGHQAETQRKWLVFGIVSIALFMSSLDATIVATGLPTLRHALHTGINWAGWTMTGYQLGLVITMPLAGRTSDSLGRKRVFLAAAVVFTASSLLCGLSTDIGMLIILRVVQAAGGAAFMPAASGIVLDIFGSNRQSVLGMFSSIFAIGAVVGPIAGGLIISSWSWRGLFLVNVPIGVLFTILAARFLPSSQPRPGRPDLLGAAQFGGGFLGLMLAISNLGNPRTILASVPCLVPFALSLACFGAFWRHCNRSPSPLVPVHLLKGRVFPAANVINLLWGACAVGLGSLLPLFSQERYGFGPLESGTLLTARAAGQIVTALVASLAIRRTGYRAPIVIGIVLIASGLVMATVRSPAGYAYAWLALGATVSGLGTGLSAPAANNASIELAPRDIGAISGLRGSVRQGGAILAISLGTSLAARSRHPSATLGLCFLVISVLFVCVAPLALLLPAGQHGKSPSEVGAGADADALVAKDGVTTTSAVGGQVDL